MKENMQHVEINQSGDAQRKAVRRRFAAYIERMKLRRKGEAQCVRT